MVSNIGQTAEEMLAVMLGGLASVQQHAAASAGGLACRSIDRPYADDSESDENEDERQTPARPIGAVQDAVVDSSEDDDEGETPAPRGAVHGSIFDRPVVSSDDEGDDELTAELMAALAEPTPDEAADDMSSLFGDDDDEEAAAIPSTERADQESLEATTGASEAHADHESADGEEEVEEEEEEEKEEEERVTAAEIVAGVSAPAVATSSGLASTARAPAAAAAAESVASAPAVAVATSSVPAIPATRRGLALPGAATNAPAQVGGARTTAVSTARQTLALPSAAASASAQSGGAETTAIEPPKPRVALSVSAAAPAAIPAPQTLPARGPADAVAPVGDDVSEASSSPAEGSPRAAKTRKNKEIPVSDKRYTFHCRFASRFEKACGGDFASATSLRNHMNRVHQLYAPGSKSYKCGLCGKLFPSEKAVCPLDKVCRLAPGSKAKWFPQRVEDMTREDMANTWCLAEHGTPSQLVKRPNGQYQAKAEQTGTKRKAPGDDADDDLLVTGSGPAKQPRTDFSAPPSLPTPAHTPPGGDDDCVIVRSGPASHPMATVPAPPSAMMPARAPARAPGQFPPPEQQVAPASISQPAHAPAQAYPLPEAAWDQQIWELQPAQAANFGAVSAPPQALVPEYQPMQAPGYPLPYGMAAQHAAVVGFLAPQHAVMPVYGAPQPLQYGQQMGMQPAALSSVSAPWNPAMQGYGAPQPQLYGQPTGMQSAFQGAPSGIPAPWNPAVQGYGDPWAQGQQMAWIGGMGGMQGGGFGY